MDLSWLDDLNTQQRAAVTHGGGPLLVVAGAGSGKTRTLASRVAYLVATGVPPERILLLTFTRRAAEEMLRRAETVMQKSSTTIGRVWGGTFHSPHIRQRGWASPRFHRDGRKRQRRHAERDPPRIGSGQHGKALPKETHPARHLFPLCQWNGNPGTCAGKTIPMVSGMAGTTSPDFQELRGTKTPALTSRLRRPPALLGANAP